MVPIMLFIAEPLATGGDMGGGGGGGGKVLAESLPKPCRGPLEYMVGSSGEEDALRMGFNSTSQPNQ